MNVQQKSAGHDPTPTATPISGHAGSKTDSSPTPASSVSASPTPMSTAATAKTPLPTPRPTATITPTPTAAPTATPTGPQTHTISFAGNAFSPNSITIKSGDTLTFVNNSNVNMWPASDAHPSHTDYPGFDPLKSITPGNSWSFTFGTPGDWDYHDHIKPSLTGTVKVQ